jgi:hypothetical protein
MRQKKQIILRKVEGQKKRKTRVREREREERRMRDEGRWGYANRSIHGNQEILRCAYWHSCTACEIQHTLLKYSPKHEFETLIEIIFESCFIHW